VRFQAIFFDLFNTLLHFDFSLLPQVEFQGQLLPTTSAEVYRQLSESKNPSFSYERFLEEFLESREIVTQLRNEEHREFSCLERFRILCKRLNVQDESVAEFIVKAHMDEMFRIMHFPEDREALLDQLTDFPLILVSNFDHASTVRRALGKFGLEERFEGIFISDEVGWRKPGNEFYKVVLEKTGHSPQQCLYVGDDPEADVYGASRQGFQVAWLVENGPPEDLPVQPKWIIRDLSHVLEIVKETDI
jgi:putative hydrolase of the HAD superfamily